MSGPVLARAVVWPPKAASGSVSSSASSSAPKVACFKGSVLLQFNRDNNRFSERTEDADLGQPTAEIPEVTAPTEEIPTDLGIPQDDAALDQMLRGLLADISPDSGEAMASALGLLVDVDHCSESSSNMD